MFFKVHTFTVHPARIDSALGKEGFSPPTYPRMTRSSVDARARRRASHTLTRDRCEIILFIHHITSSRDVTARRIARSR